MATAPKMDAFARSYIETALRSSTDDDGKSLDAVYGPDDIATDTLAAMLADCADFQAGFGAFFVGRESQAGHDFWLTRNGHGAGFWDGDWADPYSPDTDPEDPDWHPEAGRYLTVGDYLTAMSKSYGSYDLYVGIADLVEGA